jgi:hypothetical protein
MLNGRLYNADNMNETGNREKVRLRFWWQLPHGDTVTLPVTNKETYLFTAEDGEN